MEKDNLENDRLDYDTQAHDTIGKGRHRTTFPRWAGDRITAVRRLVASRLDGAASRLNGLDGRSRRLVVAAVGVAVLSLGAIAANAAVSGDGPSPAGVAATAPSTEDPALEERAEDAERTDRSDRSTPGAAGAEEPKESPEPSPTEAEETEEEPEPEPEPEEAEETEDAEEADAEQAEEEQPDWVHPMPGASTTSCYGQRWGALHAGVDLAAPAGEPIQAVGAGTVTDAGWAFAGYGISVVIDHHNGVYTHYAHMSETAVSPGESVSPGQTIGYEGSTGDSTGPHLHFEVHSGMWNQIEPTSWMSDRGVTIGGC